MADFSTSDMPFNPRIWGSKRKLFFTLGVIGLVLLTISALRRPDHLRALSVYLPGDQDALSSKNFKNLRNRTLGVYALVVIDLPES